MYDWALNEVACWYKYLMNKTASSWHVFSSLFLFQSTMFLVGLSGGIASGKSTVVAVLRELGCAVIDADVIAREGSFCIADLSPRCSPDNWD